MGWVKTAPTRHRHDFPSSQEIAIDLTRRAARVGDVWECRCGARSTVVGIKDRYHNEGGTEHWIVWEPADEWWRE